MISPHEPRLRISVSSAITSGGTVARYGSAVALTLLAAILTNLMWAKISPTVSLFFFLAVLFTSWYGGLRPGLLTSLLSAVFCNYYFLHPSGSLTLAADDLLRTTTFMLAAIFVSTLNTAKQQAEEAAQKAEKQLSITLKSIGDAVVTTDARGRITFMNSVAQSLTGWAAYEATGRYVEEIFRMVDEETRAEIETVVTRVLQDNVVLGVGSKAMLLTRDGSEIPVDEIATTIRDSEADTAGAVLVVRTVTARNNSHERQRVLKEQLSLLEAIDAHMYAVDLDGRCLFASRSVSELLGYRPEGLVGRNIHELIHRTDAEQPDSEDECTVCDSTNSLGRGQVSEVVWRRDGTAVPVGLSSTPIVLGDEVLGRVIRVTDLTLHQHAQEALTRLAFIENAVDEAIIIHTPDGLITDWNGSAERIFGYSRDEVVSRHVSIIHPPGRKQELEELFGRAQRREPLDTFETFRIKRGGDRIEISVTIRPLVDARGNVTAILQIAKDLTAQREAEGLAARIQHEAQPEGSVHVSRAETRIQYRASNRPESGRVSSRSMDKLQGAALRESASSQPAALIGSSPPMIKLFETIERIAPTESSVLITGSTGTGKELVARAIHEKSLRANGPFVDINCSAIPETLIEAELFGHQKGTFTGAHENRPGLFEIASGGTLFLDEIDALPLAAQAKLLRVLQERRVRRIGGRTNIAINVRIISASNSDLANAMADNRFRSDLFYRLRVVPLHVPELCQRAGDVEVLVEHFLQRYAERYGVAQRLFTLEAMRVLLDYPWPGNVRELENAVEYALAIAVDEEELGVHDLPLEIINSDKSQGPEDLNEVLQAYISGSVPLAEIEKRYILSVLQHFDGNQVRAAAALGIDRSKLYRRLKQYGVRAVKFLQEEQLDGLQFRTSSSDQPVTE